MKLRILYLSILTTLLFSCIQKEVELFDSSITGISLVSARNDSSLYEFVYKPEIVTEDTIKIPVKIIGAIVDYDRIIKVGIIDSATNVVSPTDYKIIDPIIKANEFTTNIQVVMYRTESVKAANEKRLRIMLESNDEFHHVNKSAYIWSIVWTDGIYKQPSGWSNSYFGVFSQNKFKFMINITGVTTFAGTTTAFKQWVQAKCKNAYNQIKAVPGYTPIIDEITMLEIVFP